MTTFDAMQGGTFRPQIATFRLIGSSALALGVFLTGFVIHEPAPTDAVIALLLGIWFILGLKVTRGTGPLAILLVAVETGCLLSLTQMANLETGLSYFGVSAFLALTAIFYAAIFEDRYDRMGLVFKAWTAAAVITSLLGILGYFHAFPGSEVFTRYDRAMGAFKDPNVFGPYIVGPALYLIHGILTGKTYHLPIRVLALLVITLGELLSFSRAAWGLYIFAAMALVFIMLLKERTSAFRLKILIIAIAGAALLIAAVMIALQFQKVADLFSTRSQLVQSYDGGHLGRFERHRLGFLMSMEKPLGIGPMVFSTIFPEDEHNIWLKMLTSYGWLGFVSYVTLMAWTIAAGFRILLRNRPWQPYLMIAWIMLLGHVGIGNVIDTDHWRHFYLILGIIWACRALEMNYQRQKVPEQAPDAVATHA
ncbi:O-antigen ligase family protein [Rhizobium sp. C1]|uniref:O-antigen ligase family protein n=1 Tax=Rhizobium sp. C1 TaxID=1349799 RepID=UPI003FA73D73